MLAKELKEILKSVPDDAELVLSADSLIMAHTGRFDRVGELYDEPSVENGEVNSAWYNNDINFPEVILKISATINN